MLVANGRHCSNCGTPFFSGIGRSPGIEYVICDSSLAGSNGMELCKKCSDHEEHEIERVGTNHIPELLKLYKKS